MDLSTLITNKTPHCPDDGSAEPKRYSVNWICFSINPHFLFKLLVVNFSSYIYIYIYIYIVIHRQTVWLDIQDASSWDQNPPNFILDWVFYRSVI